MLIVYCDKCGLRIPESDIASGVAVKPDESTYLCAACNPAAARKQSTRIMPRKSGSALLPPGKSGMMKTLNQPLPAPATEIARPVTAARVPPVTAKPPAKPVLPFVLAGCGGLALVIVLAVVLTGSKAQPRPAVENKDAPPPGLVTTPITEPKKAVQPVEPAKIDPLAALLEKTKDNPRERVTVEMLKEICDWFAKNPNDPWGYQVKLETFAGVRSPSLAATEAERMAAAVKIPEGEIPRESLAWHKAWSLASYDVTQNGMKEEFGGRKAVYLTHPAANGQPCVMTRRVVVPQDTPVLTFDIRAHDRIGGDAGDFRLVCEIEGRKLVDESIVGPEWRAFALDLKALAGKEAQLSLQHHNTGWNCEQAYWQAPQFAAVAPPGAKVVAYAAETATPVAVTEPKPPTTPATVTTSVTDDVEAADPQAIWRTAVDLLALVDPAQDRVAGTWTYKTGEGLISGKEKHERLELPYRPPEEYDLKVVFTRRESLTSECMVLMLARGGKPFTFVLGGWRNTVMAFEVIGGKRGSDNATSRKRPEGWITNGVKYTCTIQVRKDGLRAFFDGKPVTELKTNYGDLTLADEWKLRDAGALGIGTFESVFCVHSIQVAEITGKGAFTRSEREAVKALAEAANLLASRGAPRATAYLEKRARTPPLSSSPQRMQREIHFLKDVEAVEEAALKGAALLADQRAFTLVRSDGEKVPVGKGNANTVLAVKDGLIELERSVGSGKITARVPLEELGLQTRMELARLVLPENAALPRACAALLLYIAGAAGQSEADVRAHLEGLSKAGVAKDRVEHLQRQLDGAAAVRKVDDVASAARWREAKPLIDACRKTHATTLAVLLADDRLDRYAADIERGSADPFKPGMWMSFWSGNKDNKFQRNYPNLSRAEAKLCHGWGKGGPGPGVPGDFFGLKWNGKLRVVKAGRYTFRCQGDDGIALWINGQKIVEKGEAAVALQAGDHDIRILYFEHQGDAGLQVHWKLDGGFDWQEIPPAALKHDPKQTARYERE